MIAVVGRHPVGDTGRKGDGVGVDGDVENVVLAAFPAADDGVFVVLVVHVVERLEVEGGGVVDGVAARSNRVFNGYGLDVAIGAESLRHRDKVVDQEVGAICADVIRQRGN